MSKNKTCLVIGGGRGMGAAVANEMQQRGYQLALMSPSESCEILARELGGIARRGRAENLSDISEVIKLTMKNYGRIDSILIHVGGPPKGELLEIENADWQKAHEMVILPVINIARLGA